MALKFVKKEAVEGHRLRTANPVHTCVIDYSLMHYVGNVAGKSVLDMACGEGRHLRMLKMNGASKAVGVDISEEMLRQAVAVEKKSPVGCTYQLCDLRKLDKIGEFDVIIAVCLFPYAETSDELKMICRNVCLNLKKGGKFVAISYNCRVEEPDWSHCQSKYGVCLVPDEGENEEGRRTVNTNISPPTGGFFTVKNYWYPYDVMDNVFSNSGFSRYSFEVPKLDPQIVAQYPAGHWDAYRHRPSHTIYVAFK